MTHWGLAFQCAAEALCLGDYIDRTYEKRAKMAKTELHRLYVLTRNAFDNCMRSALQTDYIFRRLARGYFDAAEAYVRELEQGADESAPAAGGPSEDYQAGVRAALAEMQEVYGLDSLAERRIRERFLLPPATLLDTVKAQAQLAEIAADEVAHAESPEGVYEVAHKALVSIANALHAAAAREKG